MDQKTLRTLWSRINNLFWKNRTITVQVMRGARRKLKLTPLDAGSEVMRTRGRIVSAICFVMLLGRKR